MLVLVIILNQVIMFEAVNVSLFLYPLIHTLKVSGLFLFLLLQMFSMDINMQYLCEDKTYFFLGSRFLANSS